MPAVYFASVSDTDHKDKDELILNICDDAVAWSPLHLRTERVSVRP